MGYKYKAFISYNHNERDSKVAAALHRMIETYTIPRKLREGGGRKPGKVFRDEEELSVSDDLSQHIRDALDGAEYLIVICSPGAVASRWVRQEISHFLQNHAPERVLTVLTGGEPEEIFGKLLPDLPEPLSLDLTKSTDADLHRDLKERFLKLCAPLLGCEYDDLFMRDQKRKRRQLLWWLAGITAVASLIIGILAWSNWQIEGKNAELERQNNELLLRESEILTQEALEALDNKDQDTAIRYALDALPSAEEDRPYYAPAEQVLWSALDPLNMEEDSVIPRNVVLEQNTAIRDHCISTDGRMVTTVDNFCLMTCFDAATGEQVWTRKLTSDNSLQVSALIPCGLHNSLIVACGDTIFSLSQETGEILWTFQKDSLSGELHLTEDGSHGIFLSNSWLDETFSLGYFSTENGALLRTIQVAASQEWSSSHPYDISADGTLFAGYYCIRTPEDTFLPTYYVTDLTTGETQTLLQLPESDYTPSVHYLVFSDDDTTLTAVRSSDDSKSAAIVEKLRISDQTLLWQCITPAPDDPLVSFSAFGTRHFADCGKYLLVGTENHLYALDPETGEVLTERVLDAALRLLEPRNDGFFALTLADGTHSFGWRNSYGLFTLKDFTLFPGHPVMELGELSRITLWNDGYLRISKGETSPIVTIDTEDEHLGWALIAPEDNPRKLIAKHVEPFSVDLDQQTLLSFSTVDYATYSDFSLCSEDTLEYHYLTEDEHGSRGYRHIFLDRETLTVTKDQLTSPPYASNSSAYSTSGGGSYLYRNSQWNICAYDPGTGSSTVLFPTNGPVRFQTGDVHTEARVYSYDFRRRTQDYKLLTAAATELGLKLWLDEKALADVRYPDDLKWPGTCSTVMENLVLGSNGYILMDFLSNIEDPANDHYYLYDTREGQWHRFPFGEQDRAHHIAVLGETTPIFTVMDNGGVIRSYDIPGEALTLEFSTGLNSNAVSQLKWILEDRYLAVSTYDGILLVLDGTTGELVYQTDQVYQPFFAADPAGKRLYIWSSTGICVNIETWTTLTEIKRIDYYDPITDRILYTETDYQEYLEPYKLVSYRLPTTEELVELGKQFLGE